MATINSFQAGYCTHPGCIAVRGRGLASCIFPAQTYLIEANGRRWLWDTGYAHYFTDATAKGVFQLYSKVTPVYFESSEAILSQLNALGIRPNDLSGVILSHFHGDHIAGLRDFSQVPYLCSGAGWAKTRTLKGWAALRKGFVPELIPESFENHVQFMECFERVSLPKSLLPFTHGYAVPNSQLTLLLVALPGHAAGHIGMFVHCEKGWVLLAGDAAWSQQNYRDWRLPAKITHLIMDNPREFYQSLQWLHHLDNNGIPILLSHEKE